MGGEGRVWAVLSQLEVAGVGRASLHPKRGQGKMEGGGLEVRVEG